MEVNYFATIALSKAVLPQMIKTGEGHIVAVRSIVGKFGFPMRSAYSASKHALHGFFETAQAEFNNENINFFALAGHTHKGQIFPFSILTKIFHKHFYGLYKINNSHLYVTSGIGSWGPKMRFLAPAEIPLITLIPSK